MPRKKPDPNRVILKRVSGFRTVLWDVFTRTSGIHLGDVRYSPIDRNSNCYTAWTRSKQIGFYRTRGAAVEALIALARREIAEALA